MTVRFVLCDFCQTMADFTQMHMCPACRKTICKKCKREGALKAGECAKKERCVKEGLGAGG
ncbi:hypothetical protein BH09SUM1_BH09SUM1_18410 [soil metagenome]